MGLQNTVDAQEYRLKVRNDPFCESKGCEATSSLEAHSLLDTWIIFNSTGTLLQYRLVCPFCSLQFDFAHIPSLGIARGKVEGENGCLRRSKYFHRLELIGITLFLRKS